MSSVFGDNLKLSIFGQSHSPAIGMVLDGVPAGLPVDVHRLQEFLNRRAPGQNEWSTPRREMDTPEFLGGLLDGFTCGAPIAATIRNTNTKPADYKTISCCPRPGHADFTADVKYGGFQDASGGGHFSGRMTAPLCVAGGLCIQWLETMGIRIGAHILSIGSASDQPFDTLEPQLQQVHAVFPVLDCQRGERMRDIIADARSRGDSVGGVIECAVTGLPAGIGEPMFGGVEGRVSQIVFGIPAVKGILFGNPAEYGSENNDAFYNDHGVVKTRTNHCGGILGGITNGMPFLFRVTIKPTPSVACVQETVDLSLGIDTCIAVKGRHDPCIVPRAVPVVEAAAAIALFDLILGNTMAKERKPNGIV